MKIIAILALASTVVTFAAGDTAAIVQGLDRKLRTDAQVQVIEDDADADFNLKCHTDNDGYIEKLKAGEYTASRFYECFRTSKQIFEYADKLMKQNPKLLTREAISTTVQNKTIYAYKLTSGFAKKKSLYFQSLLHAREWVAGSSNLYALSAILDDMAHGKVSAADSYNLYFVPIVNIDGYDISWTKGKRLQRKNANEVDLNRNWPARFDHPKEDKVSSSPRFPGPGALSEPETKGIVDWIQNKTETSGLVGWVDVHSYAGKILYPNGDTEQLIGNDDDEKFKVLGRKVAAAAAADGKPYTSQTAGSFTVAIGAFDDYIYRTYQKPVVTIEIDGESFVAPPSSIRTHGKEIYRALTQFADEVHPFEGGGGGIVFPDEVEAFEGN
ncbi:hypothetical protein DYB36_013801 [Aphanomyces astaci]|uniref:Peptidase M14 domain-containing protein n=1 Tax=Aphanomyces astaci TaxID=112090 RepID=A0A396ZZB5_APHAT|nr:hypothetical protein DYB36_013801 [Aphanomyces astaci]